MAVGVAGLILLGCSASEPVIPSATVQREIPLGQREVTTTRLPDTTVVTTTVVTTTIGATTTVVVDSVPPATVRRPLVVGPSPDDLEALFAATILADQVQRAESYLPAAERSRDRLLEVMTARVADPVLAGFAAVDAKQRRFEAGTIDERLVLRMENYSDRDGTAEVILCKQNNGAEFDTKGTLDTNDDALVQDDLATSGLRVQMIRADGSWKRNAIIKDKGEQCINAFSPRS